MSQPRNTDTGRYEDGYSPEVSRELARYAALAERPSYDKIARLVNAEFGTQVSASGIRKHITRVRETLKASEPEPAPIYDIHAVPERDFARENDQLRQANRRLFEQVVRYKDRTDDLVRATIDGARDAMVSMGPLQAVHYLYDEQDHVAPDTEAALWHLTDWQGAKKTTSYNSAVMRERVLRFCKKAVKITNIQREHHDVDELAILFGGDMIEGLFNFPTQPFEIDATIFGQFVTVGRLMVDVVQYALSAYPRVRVIAEWGNHGRIGSKRDAVPKSDNFDRMTYELARQLLADQTRLTWEDCPEDIQRVEIGHYRALSIHGDEIGRMGYAAPSTILQWANRQRSGAYNWDFRDIYVGHYHHHAEQAMANGLGMLYHTGSTESDNRYARDNLAASAIPSQRLHFIDKTRGRVSAQYKIYLDQD